MGSKKETTSTSTIGAKDPGQQALEDLYTQQAQQAAGQLNLGGGASGQDIFQITPELRALVDSAVGGQADISRRQAGQDYDEAERLMRANLLKRGQGDSSFEGISQATLGREHYSNLADIESQRSSGAAQGLLGLVQSGEQNKLGYNQLLLQQLGMANPVLGAYQQSRMGTGTQTNVEEQSGLGNTFGQFAQLGSSVFGGGGIFGKA